MRGFPAARTSPREQRLMDRRRLSEAARWRVQRDALRQRSRARRSQRGRRRVAVDLCTSACALLTAARDASRMESGDHSRRSRRSTLQVADEACPRPCDFLLRRPRRAALPLADRPTPSGQTTRTSKHTNLAQDHSINPDHSVAGDQAGHQQPAAVGERQARRLARDGDSAGGRAWLPQIDARDLVAVAVAGVAPAPVIGQRHAHGRAADD